jgi:hypothetical protein
MANKIVLKKSSVAAKVPLSTDLEVGEIAVNLVDQKLYSKKTDGTVILVGSAAGGVDSVNGQTGIVVLDAADVGAVGTITSSDGSINVAATGSTVDITVSEASPASTLLGAVRNQTGATLTKGTVVYISGATGNKALVSKAIATSDATSAQTYGVITTDLANNANGFVTIVGALTNLNTSAFTEGVQLYLSATTAGAYTSTKQYAPNHLVYVGVVTRSHPTQGSIEVKIQNGYEMDELHNVSAQTPSNGNVLIWNATTQLWESAGISAGTGISVTNGAGSITVNNTGVTSVSGTGTVNGITLSGTVTSTGNLTLGGALSGVSLTTQVSGTLPLANGGTNATSAADARTNLNVPTRTGGDASGNWSINAATATTATNQSGGTVNATTGTFSNQLLINYNIAAPANYYNALQQEIRATSGTAGIGLHRAGFSHCGIYHDATDTLKFNMNGGTVTLNASIGTVIGSGNYNSYAPTLTGGGASGTWGISVTGSAASLNSSNSIARTGSSGNLNTDFNNTPAGTGRYQGDDAGLANSPGNTWWIYENKRHSNSSNSWGTQVAWGWEDNANRLATRNVQAGSFGAWVYYLNSANYGSFALPLAGGGMTGLLATVGNTAAFTGANDTTLSVRSSGPSTAASMSFHRPGAYAVNLGLDTDNVFKLGGWSAGGVQNYWDFSGNAYATGSMRAPIFYDLNDTAWYCDPNNTSRFRILTIPSNVGSGTFPVSISSTNRGISFDNSQSVGIPCYFTVSNGATVSGSIVADGGSTNYNTSSDYRMKENIRDLDVLAAVNKIMSVRPRVFDWKEEHGGKKNSVGFIAHELDLIAPECVNGEKDAMNDDGTINPQSVDTSWLIPSICSAMQKQQELIENLTAKVAALEGI